MHDDRKDNLPLGTVRVSLRPKAPEPGRFAGVPLPPPPPPPGFVARTSPIEPPASSPRSSISLPPPPTPPPGRVSIPADQRQETVRAVIPRRQNLTPENWPSKDDINEINSNLEVSSFIKQLKENPELPQATLEKILSNRAASLEYALSEKIYSLQQAKDLTPILGQIATSLDKAASELTKEEVINGITKIALAKMTADIGDSIDAAESVKRHIIRGTAVPDIPEDLAVSKKDIIEVGASLAADELSRSKGSPDTIFSRRPDLNANLEYVLSLTSDHHYSITHNHRAIMGAADPFITGQVEQALRQNPNEFVSNLPRIRDSLSQVYKVATEALDFSRKLSPRDNKGYDSRVFGINSKIESLRPVIETLKGFGLDLSGIDQELHRIHNRYTEVYGDGPKAQVSMWKKLFG